MQNMCHILKLYLFVRICLEGIIEWLARCIYKSYNKLVSMLISVKIWNCNSVKYVYHIWKNSETSDIKQEVFILLVSNID